MKYINYGGSVEVINLNFRHGNKKPGVNLSGNEFSWNVKEIEHCCQNTMKAN